MSTPNNLARARQQWRASVAAAKWAACQIGPTHARGRIFRSGALVAAPDSLVDIELPRPSAAGRDLLVEVRAVSVNPVDYKVRFSAAPPGGGATKVIGYDAAGVVVEVASAQQGSGESYVEPALMNFRNFLMSCAAKCRLVTCYGLLDEWRFSALVVTGFFDAPRPPYTRAPIDFEKESPERAIGGLCRSARAIEPTI